MEFPLKLKSLREFEEFQARVAGTGQCFHIQVLHDAGCSPSNCTCEPEFLVEKLTPESYLKGQRLQNEWIKKTSS